MADFVIWNNPITNDDQESRQNIINKKFCLKA